MAEVTRPRSDQTRILIPLDGSPLAEQAIPFAVALAGTDGELVFLQVMPEPEPIRELRGNVMATSAEVLRMERDAAQTSLRESVDRWRTILHGEPRLEVTTGDPAEAILAAAGQLNCTLIVLASHGRGALARLAFGSVADRISRASVLPVLIVRPADAEEEIGPADVHRLLVPLDGSPLAAEALPVASAIAKHLGIGVHLLQAISPSSLVLPTPLGDPGYPTEIYTEIEQELTEAATANLNGAAKQLADAGVTATTAVVEGPPVPAIEAAVEPGDVIVMTSHGRSGVSRWLLGSTAEKLVRTGPVPVLLVPTLRPTED